MSTLKLSGVGAAYIRISDEKQVVAKQFAAIQLFENRHGVTISKQHWYKDEGWKRRQATTRPDFQRMMNLIKAGEIGWVVAEAQDRFGTKDKYEFIHFMHLLREAGCKFVTCEDKVLNDDNMMSFFEGGMGAETSQKELTGKAKNSLNAMVTFAKKGEWEGGPPPLGFDVGCFDITKMGTTSTLGAEEWRAIFEGRDTKLEKDDTGKSKLTYSNIRRRKVYPDGREERFDGPRSFREREDIQVMSLVPTRDAAKLDAVRGLFRRYAQESVSFYTLAMWLNGLKITNAFGQKFQGVNVGRLLADEIYIGYPMYNKRRRGAYRRYDAINGAVNIEPELSDKDTENKSADVIRSSVRLFEPIIDRATWDAVQKKLAGRTKSPRTPRAFSLYFGGLLVCSGCGRTMIGRNDSAEYLCASWNSHRNKGDVANSPCERNPVKHAVIEQYVKRYLDESEVRLDLILNPDLPNPTGKLEADESDASTALSDGIRRLTSYLAEHHPEEYNAIVREYTRQLAEAESSTKRAAPGTLAKIPGFIEAAEKAKKQANEPYYGQSSVIEELLACYRANFNPSELKAEIQKLETEYDKMLKQWADLPTPRAKEKAKEQFMVLEDRLKELEKQQEDAVEIVEGQYRAMVDLQGAIRSAKAKWESESGERALRQRAEAIRSVVSRIVCEFVSTGTKHHGGPKGARSKLVAVTLCPIVGSVRMMKVDDDSNLVGNSTSTRNRGTHRSRRAERRFSFAIR